MSKFYRNVPNSVSQLVMITCDRCTNKIPITPNLHTHRSFELHFSVSENDTVTGWEVPDLCDDCAEYLHDLLVSNDFHVIPYSINY